MKRISLALCLLMLCFATAQAEEYSFFQSVILSREEVLPAEQISLNDELTVSIPEHWEEIPYEEDWILGFEYEDDLARSMVCFFRLKEPDLTFDVLLEDLDEISDVMCTADKNGFEWFAGNTDDGIWVIAEGEDGWLHVILFNSEIRDVRAYERIVREFGFILHSLEPLEPAGVEQVQENADTIHTRTCRQGCPV